jgi:putative ABC transport system permease protein
VTWLLAQADPGWDGLAYAACMMALLLAVSGAAGMALLKEGLVASARTVVQLVAVGSVLNWVFEQRSLAAIALTLAVMTAVAGWTGKGRVDGALRGTGPALTLILAVGMVVTLLYVTGVVIGIDEPEPRYLIPLGGMILGNAMTAGSLAAQRFHDDLRDQRDRVEAALCLGASPRQATLPLRRRAFRAAITPTINAMMIVGIVKLPGVMTGQMLGGAEPLRAAKYQVVIMFMLACSDGLTALAMLFALGRLAFTRAWQPKL